MRHSRLFLLLALVVFAVIWFARINEDEESRPNILLIVLDDFGYNDLGVNGNADTPTPNLDALADQGMRYTRFYTDATCSAARAALLTGVSPAVHGLRPNHLGISSDTPTIASMLSQAGYLTQHVGKWHLVNATLEQSPSTLGFDHWFGFLHQFELEGADVPDGSRRKPTYRNPFLREDQSPQKQYRGHLTDILTERAIQFLDQQKDESQPWFLNLWYFAPHTPVQPAARFKSKYPDTKQGAYFALLDQLDSNIGKVLKALESNGQEENTLVIVLSDNGGTNSATNNNAPFYGKKGQFLEGGVRTPLFMRWEDHITVHSTSNEIVSIYDIFPTVAQAVGAIPPSGLVGRSLLDKDRAPSPPLYWEYSKSNEHYYSALSADGRWRFTQGTYFEPILNDLESDPFGSENVVDDYPEIISMLRSDYLQWRKSARVVDFDYEALNNRGGAILRGGDLERSPGSAGFTFAIGVTPSGQRGEQSQFIVEQAQRWHLQSDQETGINLEVLGQQLNGPPLPAGRCSEVVVTAHFHFSPVHPTKNASVIDLYINRELVDSVRLKLPPSLDWGYANPTYVGFDDSGSEEFSGVLSRPIILNERVVADSLAGMLGNGIAEVPATCNADHLPPADTPGL